MKIVRKKILTEYFEGVKRREKNFEIRKDEDDIQVGDVLVLREWCAIKEQHTGNVVRRKVKYVLRNASQYGLMEGYCIIGF